VAVRPPLALPCLVWSPLVSSSHPLPCLALHRCPITTAHHSTRSYTITHSLTPSLSRPCTEADHHSLLLSALHRGAHSFSRPCTEAHHSHDHTPPLTPSLGLDPTPHSLCVPPSLRTARDANGTWQGLTLGSHWMRTGFGCSWIGTGVTVSRH